ncbi:MAG: hypothetical protein LQ337_008476 [Flavoplaca oasis]|nr:MAG: hypothetical protein LQ337_008476 [Flavoplaca oasis]
MPDKSIDKCINALMAELASDLEPWDLPSASERKAVSDFLQCQIPAKEAAFTYTRDAIAENNRDDTWFLLCHVAQDLPETQDALIDLTRAILALPDESYASGKSKSWSSDGKADLHCTLRDEWDGRLSNPVLSVFLTKVIGASESLRANITPPRPRDLVNITTFIARLRSEGLITTNHFDKAIIFIALELEDSVPVMDTYLLAVSWYLKWAGRQVFIESSKDDSNPGPIMRKAMKTEEGIGRWEFWKLRLTALGNDESMSQEVRNAASSVLVRMTELESAGS